MKEFWNQRYSAEEYAYGKLPNVFYAEFLETNKLKGKALFPAEGEGRNSVFAAKNGMEAYAFDTSEEAQKKAIKLAEENGVLLNYELGMFPNLELAKEKFDLIVLIFAHFPPKILKEYHHKFAEMLNPGGYLVLEGFSKDNLKYRLKNPKVGGPDKAEMLFSKEEIAASFPGLKVELLEQLDTELTEGEFHKGTANVIRYIGQK